MPTPTEIKYPHLTYCPTFDVHCPCPKCEVSESNGCKLTTKNVCDTCVGPPKTYLGKETRGIPLGCHHMIITHRETILLHKEGKTMKRYESMD